MCCSFVGLHLGGEVMPLSTLGDKISDWISTELKRDRGCVLVSQMIRYDTRRDARLTRHASTLHLILLDGGLD